MSTELVASYLVIDIAGMDDRDDAVGRKKADARVIAGRARQRPQSGRQVRGRRARAAVAAVLAGRRMRLGRAALALVALAPSSIVSGYADAGSMEPLALSSYQLTFDEPFDSLSVSARGPGTRWIAHTPWNGDFGDARFADPSADGPFETHGGMLTITMRRQHGRLASGLLSAADAQGRGFTQSGGYFEMRAKLPGGNGVWPAFWLGSNPKPGRTHPEVDVLEYYGVSRTSYMATTHVWQDGRNVAGDAIRVAVPEGSLEDGFHTYGVAIDAKAVVFYLDRREVARLPSRAEYLQPMFPMVNLAAGGGWPTDGMPAVTAMTVDYIRAYRKR